MNSHPLSPLLLSHIVLSGLPSFVSSSLHVLFFILKLFALYPFYLTGFFFFLSLWFFSHPPLLSSLLSLSFLFQLSLLSRVSLDWPSSPLLIELEWHAAETVVAVLMGRSIWTDMEHLEHKLDSTESTEVSCTVLARNFKGHFPIFLSCRNEAMFTMWGVGYLCCHLCVL